MIQVVKLQYRAEPVIDILPGHKRPLRERGERMKAPEYRALSKQRTSVERAFSRLKGQRSLNHIRVRGLKKVTVHCYMSLIAMQAAYSRIQVSHVALWATSFPKLSMKAVVG